MASDRDVPIQLQTRPFIYATIAGIATSGPLLYMTRFTFFATSAFLIVISPLLITFNPLLLLAGVVITLSLLGFVAAVVMAAAGISAIGWTMESVNRGKVGGLLGVPVKRLVDTGSNWAGYLQSKASGCCSSVPCKS